MRGAQASVLARRERAPSARIGARGRSFGRARRARMGRARRAIFPRDSLSTGRGGPGGVAGGPGGEDTCARHARSPLLEGLGLSRAGEDAHSTVGQKILPSGNYRGKFLRRHVYASAQRRSPEARKQPNSAKPHRSSHKKVRSAASTAPPRPPPALRASPGPPATPPWTPRRSSRPSAVTLHHVGRSRDICFLRGHQPAVVPHH